MGGVSRTRGTARIAAAIALGVLPLAAPRPSAGAAASPVRAAYFYHYMGSGHLDRLAAIGFNRGVIHWIADTLGPGGAAELAAFRASADAHDLTLVPQWALQQPSRLAARPAARRYTWGGGVVETEVACPLDTSYWRSALLDRAEEFFAADSGLDRIAIDLELYRGGRHHYDAGPCRCVRCLAEYRAGARARSRDPYRPAGLLGWEEASLEQRLTVLLREFVARHPDVELGVFDLDFDSFVHRALARALRGAGARTTDYCERSYEGTGGGLPAARQRLDALGLDAAPVIGGLWLKRIRPWELRPAVQSVLQRAQGYFVFTTYSLWLEPSRLHGPYMLSGSPAEYWNALEEANAP